MLFILFLLGKIISCRNHLAYTKKLFLQLISFSFMVYFAHISDTEEWSFGLKCFRPERQFPNSHIYQTKRQIIVLFLLIDSKNSQGRIIEVPRSTVWEERAVTTESAGVFFFKTPQRPEAPRAICMCALSSETHTHIRDAEYTNTHRWIPL